MKAAIFENWHAWDAGIEIALSDESCKKLRTFRTWDHCINWLFLNGHKAAARAINSQVKA